MSDQTPPSDHPTPPPTEGADASSVGGSDAPPPPPPSEPLEGAYPPPPPAPEKKSRTGLIIAAVAGLVVLALVGTLATVLLTREDTHSITIPATAGGMKRDAESEKQLGEQLKAAEAQFKTQAKNVSYVKSGIYQQDDEKRGPVGSLVFLGAKLKKEQSPTAFVEAFSKQATDNGFEVSKISAGDLGGKAVCASQDAGQKIAICAWATKDSMGELVPTTPGYDSKMLSAILLDMRSDVEKTD